MKAKISSVVFILLCTTLCTSGQDSVAIGYAEGISEQNMEKHLRVISSDAYEGRESGYEGQRMCEEYMSTFYQNAGIPPVQGSYTQLFDLSLDDPSKVYVRTDTEEFKFLDDYYYYPATSDRKINGTILYSGYGITDKRYTDINVFDVRDKIVMVWAGEPLRDDGRYRISGKNEPSAWSTSNDKKKELVEEAGAKALFIIHSDYSARLGQVRGYFGHKGMSLLTDADKSKKGMPVFHISPEMAASLIGAKNLKKAEKALAKGKVKPIESAKVVEISFERRSEILQSSNVMAYVEGSDKKEELVVITAHYDHIGVEGELVYNGADDDGSGTVATMLIAEAFAKAKREGNGPRRSVLVLNVSAEEKGLLGSRYYTENPVFPLKNTVANLNIDMIGRVDEQHEGNENYVYLIGADRLSQDLHDVLAEVNETSVGLELDYTFNAEDDPNRFYYRSDHYNFAKNNVPAVFFFSGVHEDYHQPGDTVDKIMFPKLTKITRYIFLSAWEIANREERLRLK